ncbi:MAG: hypothetical protein QG597_3611 [Actinomycetota bacterium]|nr:hypothetical protein [Actinomycetota bacterium]
MQVVDASCLYEAVVDGERARAVELRFLADPDLVAPHLVDVEVTSAIRRNHAAGLLDGTAARLALDSLATWPGERFGHQLLTPRVWQLRDSVRVADAYYVALAEALQCPLLTLDARLPRAPGVGCDIVIPDGSGSDPTQAE